MAPVSRSGVGKSWLLAEVLKYWLVLSSRRTKLMPRPRMLVPLKYLADHLVIFSFVGNCLPFEICTRLKIDGYLAFSSSRKAPPYLP